MKNLRKNLGKGKEKSKDALKVASMKPTKGKIIKRKTSRR